MATSSTIYAYLARLFWGNSVDNDAVVDAVGVFPPRGSIVVVNGCSKAATLSFCEIGRTKYRTQGAKYVKEASMALGIVAGAGCPLVASEASRAMMKDARDVLAKSQSLRIQGVLKV